MRYPMTTVGRALFLVVLLNAQLNLQAHSTDTPVGGGDEQYSETLSVTTSNTDADASTLKSAAGPTTTATTTKQVTTTEQTTDPPPPTTATTTRSTGSSHPTLPTTPPTVAAEAAKPTLQNIPTTTGTTVTKKTSTFSPPLPLPPANAKPLKSAQSDSTAESVASYAADDAAAAVADDEYDATDNSTVIAEESEEDSSGDAPVKSAPTAKRNRKPSAAFTHNLLVSDEKLLVKRLLDRYARLGKIGRPVLNTSETVTVNFDLSLIQIVDVDEKNQVLVLNIWYNYAWIDHLLKWDPIEHGNISNIRVPSDRIWLPDILLYNFADTRLKEQREALVVVNYTGGILWMPQAILKSSCFFDITFFPFDDQECKLKFGSWTYDGFKVDVVFRTVPKMDLNDYMLSNEWDIMENVAVRNVRKYACCPEPYPDLTFRLRLRRKVAFYSFILILPCALLSLLTLVIFWVPPESPAKLQLGMNIFVAFFVLLLLLAESTPRAASSIPLIGAYFCLSMVMITLSTVFACVVANMFFRGVRVHRAPYWLRAVMIDGIARILFLRDQVMDKSQKEQSKMRNWNMKVTGENNRKYPAADVKFAKVRLLENKDEKMSASSDTLEPSVPDTVVEQHDDRQSLMRSAILEEVKAIREMLDKVQEKKMKLEERERLVREWRVIACVTDRLFFIVYVLVNVIGVLVIFVRK